MGNESVLKVCLGDRTEMIPFSGEERLVEIREKFCELTGSLKEEIVAAFVNKKLCDLNARVSEGGTVEFVGLKTPIGYDMYKRSLIFLMVTAFQKVLGSEKEHIIKVMYSLGKGYFCRLMEDVEITDRLLSDVKTKMQILVKENLPFEKSIDLSVNASKMFEERGLLEKSKLFSYRRASSANLYSMGDYTDYYYGYTVPETGSLKLFDLVKYEDGFVLVIPDKKFVLSEYQAPNKLYKTLRISEDWGDMMEVSCVGDLNDLIVNGQMNEMILVQEALMEKRIADIAEDICRKGCKLVLIAGPSSSGKTTFSKRLSVQLRAHGMKPHPIAMDNFYLNRVDTPLDENGKYDFESVDAIDLKLFDDSMTKLLSGETVDMPVFDFEQGVKVFGTQYMTMSPDDVLVVEGIHALNPRSTVSLPKESCYKIYISALTQLNLDEHNRISTTDCRMLRRIVRDNRRRGSDAAKSISMWPAVTKGENENIFPFQEEADAMFNSSLIYELAAIKQFAEPLLFKVPKDSEEYYEAKRLLKFLSYFLGIDVSFVPQTSLLREFIGGGCFGE